MEKLLNILMECWRLLGEMSPYLLLGFLLAGLMHEFVPSGLYRKYLGGRNLRSVIWAALLGVPLPLCSCGVIPTAMALRREGASKGATVSFLIATPQTGVDSIVATYSLMGLPFALVRPVVAFITAIFGGALVTAFEQPDEILIARKTTPADEHQEKEPLLHRLREAVEYGFIEMMEDIGKWLIVGLVVAGLITALVPDAWFTAFRDNSLLSILFVLVFAIPMYLCATGSIPIAVALMMKGLTPGAGLVLLMAGPASNMASILVIRKVLGNRTLGEIPDYVSQFEISPLYSQINYKGEPVRVSPLGYADLFKWLTNRDEGIPAYSLVNMTTQDAEIVRLGEGNGMKYTASEPLARNIDRYIQLKYPFYIFDEKSVFPEEKI